MTGRRSELVATLEARGFVHQGTDLDGLDALAAAGPITAYIGFDATADCLHVGSLVQIMMLRLMQRTGHRPLALVGGGTTKVGDPSGKDESRRLLTDADIEFNKAGITRSLAKFLDFGTEGGTGRAALVDNAQWLDRLGYLAFLRDFGTHFTINRMLTFDSVKLRLEREQPLTLLEFNYMVMQAYDFLELSRRYGCRLQLGGSDQWGNIVNGVELGRRVDGVQLFGLTTPLVTTASGAKMGKTAAGAVWLDEGRLPPFDYWQFWRNTEDGDVGRFLRLFTDLALDEVRRLEVLQGAELNVAKAVLADAATTMAHGDVAAASARAAAAGVFGAGGGEAGLPVVLVDAARLALGIGVIELFVLAGLATSNSEVRRLLRAGALKLADRPLVDELQTIATTDLAGSGLKLTAGKKRHVLVRAG